VVTKNKIEEEKSSDGKAEVDDINLEQSKEEEKN